MSSVRWISLALIVLTVGVYAPVRHFDFVSVDDPLYVSENAHVGDGLTWAGVQWAFTTGTAANWHPLTWISLMADVSMFGPRPGAMHVVNLLFHLASTLLLFHLLRRMTGAVWPSAAVAALFAIHPLHVESVAWIAERKDVLSGLLGISAIGAYVRYAHAPSAGRYALVLSLFALGLLAKPMLVTLPFVFVLLDAWPLGRWHLGRSLWLEKIPLLVFSLASSVVTFAVQHSGGSMADVQQIPLASRIATAVVSYVSYLRQAIWPSGLMVIYPIREISTAELAGACVVLAAITAGTLIARRRHPYLAVGWFWFLGMLVPVIGLVQVGMQSRADRYTYLPLIGVFVAIAWGMNAIAAKSRAASRVAAAAAGVSIVVLGVAARQQVGYWQNGIALFTRATEVQFGIDEYEAHMKLGPPLRDQHRVDEAITHLSDAVRLRPESAEAHRELGLTLQQAGRLNEAINEYQEAVRLTPGVAELENNLGSALAISNRLEEARQHFAEAVRLRPDFDLARMNLAIANIRLNKKDDAVAELQELLRRNPNDARARALLEQVLSGRG